MKDRPVIAPSARKHGIADEAMLHAFGHPIRVLEVGDGFIMLIGPDPAANLLEIGVVDATDGPVIVHAMAARTKFLE